MRGGTLGSFETSGSVARSRALPWPCWISPVGVMAKACGGDLAASPAGRSACSCRFRCGNPNDGSEPALLTLRNLCSSFGTSSDHEAAAEMVEAAMSQRAATTQRTIRYVQHVGGLFLANLPPIGGRLKIGACALRHVREPRCHLVLV